MIILMLVFYNIIYKYKHFIKKTFELSEKSYI